MDIGDRIRHIRGKRSRAEFAELLGIHPQTLYMYEKGKRVVDVDLVQQLCRGFNVPVEWLIFGEGGLQALEYASAPAVPLLDIAPTELEIRLAEENAELKDELIAAQAKALSAYELALAAAHEKFTDRDVAQRDSAELVKKE